MCVLFLVEIVVQQKKRRYLAWLWYAHRRTPTPTHTYTTNPSMSSWQQKTKKILDYDNHHFRMQYHAQLLCPSSSSLFVLFCFCFFFLVTKIRQAKKLNLYFCLNFFFCCCLKEFHYRKFTFLFKFESGFLLLCVCVLTNLTLKMFNAKEKGFVCLFVCLPE